MEKEALYGLYPLFDGILSTLMCQNLILIMGASFKLSYFLILIFFFLNILLLSKDLFTCFVCMKQRDRERSCAMPRCALRGQKATSQASVLSFHFVLRQVLFSALPLPTRAFQQSFGLSLLSCCRN